jgi:PAS domain S-box-containing protein
MAAVPLQSSSLGQFSDAVHDRLGGLKVILDAIPAAVYTTDAEGRVTGFNEAAVRFSGRVPRLGSDSWCVTWKLYRPDGTPLPHDQCPMAVALKEGREIRGVTAIAERPDGTRVHFMPYPTLLRDARGKIVGAVNMLVDLSEQMRADELQARLAAIVDSSSDAIFSTSLDGTIRTWNRGAERLFGWSEFEAVGQPSKLIIPQDRRAEEEGVLERIRRGEMVSHLETTRISKSGRLLDISLTVSPIRDAHGNIIGAARIPRDITDRKHEEEVRARLAAIVASSDDAIVSKSLDGIIRTWNRGAERIFGYRAEEAVGRHITLIIPDERRAEEDMVLGKIRRGEVVDHFETVRRTKDGRLIDISLMVSPIRDPRGRVIGASKIARDITDRKRMDALVRESEERLRSMVAGLRQADEKKDEFIALLAHELRNPISAIAVASDLLARSTIEDRKARFAVPAIARQVKQLRRLVDDLLNMARITTGKLVLRRSPVELVSFVGRVAADRRAMAAPGVEILVSGAPTWVEADSARLQQMIENLLDNATKYGGKRIALSVGQDAGRGTLAVRDDGAGMSPETLASLFKPFVQGEQPADREQHGLGGGRAPGERLAALHGGSVSAKSEGPGRGSTFIIVLPLAARQAAPEAPVATRKSVRRRVLVVEDEDDSRDALKLLLETEGHEVALTADGAHAIEEVARFRPDFALVDVGLPGMDGYEVARRVRELPEGKSLKLIALTGFGGDKYRRRAKEAGFDMHVVKPISYEELVRVFSDA